MITYEDYKEAQKLISDYEIINGVKPITDGQKISESIEKAFEHWYCTYENSWSKPPTFRMITDWFFEKVFLDQLHLEEVSKPSRGCCYECGEGYDNEEEWLYNTECELCGHPIPEHLIVKKSISY